MEIHSSSLAFIPNGYHPKNTKKQETESIQHQAPQSLALVERIEKPVETKSFQQLTTIIESQQTILTNSPTARALDAYVQESIKPLKTQRSEFISSIDFFA
jgi:hypothetical protein